MTASRIERVGGWIFDPPILMERLSWRKPVRGLSKWLLWFA
jgi:hypothetical protein